MKRLFVLFLLATAPLVAREVNVKDPLYGAVGDGIADDTVAIQAAINAFPTESTVIVFPSGVYLTGPLTITCNPMVQPCPRPLTLIGQRAILKARSAPAASVTTILQVFSAAQGTRIQQLSFAGAGQLNGFQSAIEASSPNTTVKDCTFDGAFSGRVVRFNGSPDSLIEGNRFEWTAGLKNPEPSSGLETNAIALVYQSDRFVARGNHLIRTLGTGEPTRGLDVIKSNDVEISNNTLRVNVTVAGLPTITPIQVWGELDVAGTTWRNPRIIGNSISGAYGNQIYVNNRVKGGVITGNTIRDHQGGGGGGIRVGSECDDTIVSGNTVTDAVGTGLMSGVSVGRTTGHPLEGHPQYVIITGNILARNNHHGIIVSGHGANIDGNIIRDNAYIGQVLVNASATGTKVGRTNVFVGVGGGIRDLAAMGETETPCSLCVEP